MNTLVRVNPAEEDQVVTARFLQRVQREIDPVIYGSQVIQPGRSIEVADGNEVSVVVLLVHRHDFRRGTSVDRSQYRCAFQPCVSQCDEVVMAVDQVKLGGPFECGGDVKVFGHLGIGGGFLFLSLINNGVQ